MPVSPTKVDSLADTNKVKEAVRIIDSKLSNPRFMSDFRCWPRGNYWWDILLHTELDYAEKTIVRSMYALAGWKSVECVNSSDDGERPGLCRVRLYK